MTFGTEGSARVAGPSAAPVAGAGAAPGAPALPAGGEAEPMDEDALLQQALAMSMQARATLLRCRGSAGVRRAVTLVLPELQAGLGCSASTPLCPDGCTPGRPAGFAQPWS